MTERLNRQLGPDAQRALRLATRLVGKTPVVVRKPQLPNEVRGMLVRPLNPRKPYQIQLARGQERFLDHIATHEVGHLVRLYQVPEEERLMPVSTAANRRRAIHQIVDEIIPLQRRGIPESALPTLFDGWYKGVCSQLASFPADLHIEAWIHREFPGLRPVQRRSLFLEVQRGFPAFAPEVAALTPPTMYRATMAMNAAQALHVAELYRAPDLALPYHNAGFAEVGLRLAEIALQPPDEGHRSDMVAVARWADKLRLEGWISWQPPGERCLGIEVSVK